MKRLTNYNVKDKTYWYLIISIYEVRQTPNTSLKGIVMSTIGQGRIKVVRLFVTRTVKQSAEITVEIEDEDYEDIKSAKINFQTFFDKKFKDSAGYDNIGWLETNAGETHVERGEVGKFHEEEFFV